MFPLNKKIIVFCSIVAKILNVAVYASLCIFLVIAWCVHWCRRENKRMKRGTKNKFDICIYTVKKRDNHIKVLIRIRYNMNMKNFKYGTFFYK